MSRYRFWVRLAPVCLLAACSHPAHPAPVVPVADTTTHAPPPAPVVVRDPEQDRRIAQLEFQMMERDTEIQALQGRVDDARLEVVRAMAKVPGLATRAEAASGMAEAEVAVQSLKSAAGTQTVPEMAQAVGLLHQSTGEFDKQNFGGALYLANQAKGVAASGSGRLGEVDRNTLRPGEILFTIPLSSHTSGNANVRAGPGTTFKVTYTLESGAAITVFSIADDWVRITDDSGRSGWIFRNLIARRAAGGR